MAYSETDILRMIDRLHEAALDPSLLETAFQGLADAVGGGAVSALSVKTDSPDLLYLEGSFASNQPSGIPRTPFFDTWVKF